MKKIFTFFIFVCFYITGFATYAQSCKMLFMQPTSSEILNAKASRAAPELDFILNDADLFYKKMEARFFEQKMLTPNNPYLFDFSEVGLPVVKKVQTFINRKIDRLKAEAEVKDVSFWSALLKSTFKSLQRKKKIEFDILIEHLSALNNEAEKILSDGKISYRHLVEFTYFYSRAIGQFDNRNYSLKDRMMLVRDRKLQGYNVVSPIQEYKDYVQRNFKAFYLDSYFSDFKETIKPLEEAFYDPENLRSLWIPTTVELGTTPLLRLMRTKMHFISVADEPIWADGYNRPPGDFWIHDVRHASFKHFELENYIERHELDEKQESRMYQKMDDWYLELSEEIAKIKDKDLRRAIGMTIFTFHHDSGYPFAPSFYLSFKKYKQVRHLYMIYLFSGHGLFLKQPWKNFDRAEIWLKAFWKERLDQEVEVLGGSAQPFR